MKRIDVLRVHLADRVINAAEQLLDRVISAAERERWRVLGDDAIDGRAYTVRIVGAWPLSHPDADEDAWPAALIDQAEAAAS